MDLSKPVAGSDSTTQPHPDDLADVAAWSNRKLLTFLADVPEEIESVTAAIARRREDIERHRALLLVLFDRRVEATAELRKRLTDSNTEGTVTL